MHLAAVGRGRGWLPFHVPHFRGGAWAVRTPVTQGRQDPLYRGRLWSPRAHTSDDPTVGCIHHQREWPARDCCGLQGHNTVAEPGTNAGGHDPARRRQQHRHNTVAEPGTNAGPSGCKPLVKVCRFGLGRNGLPSLPATCGDEVLQCEASPYAGQTWLAASVAITRQPALPQGHQPSPSARRAGPLCDGTWSTRPKPQSRAWPARPVSEPRFHRGNHARLCYVAHIS